MINNKEEILEQIKRLQGELQDLIELRNAFLGQTGVHIGMRVLKDARRKFDQEESRIKQQLDRLEEIMKELQSASI